MAIYINAAWKSSHEVMPPVGVSEEHFEKLLREADEDAWQHALDQVESSTAELTDWMLA